ncbi:MAG: hypothetical protein E6J14_06190 [Chloroflexi bacterium]|nr:MAG: hypothetical protein E6J14_06190 [Chloroflexota bacterium]
MSILLKPWDWWTGDRTEAAYSALHRADGAYLALAPAPILRQRAALLLGRLPLCGLAHDDFRLNEYRSILRKVAFPELSREQITDDVRAELKEISEVINQGSDGQHYRARTYRNMLLGTAGGLLLVFLLLSLVGWRDPSFFSLCSADASASCPSGGAPGAGDVFLLGLAGVAGGSLGALAMLLNVKVTGGPYTLAIAQALLKLPAGALISLIALFTMQHDVLGILKPQAGNALVAWAMVFGIAQQAVTRAVDKRANSLLNGSTAGPPGPTGGVDPHGPKLPGGGVAPGGNSDTSGEAEPIADKAPGDRTP